MARRTRKKSKRQKRRKRREAIRRRRQRAIGRAVILLDSGPIRRKRTGVFRRLKRALEKARAEEERYESEDVPAYRAWLHRNFGERLSRIRELESQMEEKRSVVDAVHMEAAFRGGDHGQIYRQVMKEREAAQAREDEDASWADASDEEGQIPEWEDEGDFSGVDNDFLEYFANSIFENEFDVEFEDEAAKNAARDEFFRSWDIDGYEGKRSFEPDLKETYRRLAFRLHPDRDPSGGDERLELWHELQNAYENGDLDALLRIEAKCDIHDRTVSAHTTVSLINDIIEETREMLRAVRSFIRVAKRGPEWEFAQTGGGSGALTLEIDSTLWQREVWLLRLIEKLDEKVNRWSRRPGRRAKRKNGSPRRARGKGNPMKGTRGSKMPESGPTQLEFPF